MTNSQERHEETRSRATTGSPMIQKPSQIEDLTACTVYPVPTTKSWDAGSGLETKEDCDILFPLPISFREKVDERLRVVLNRPPGDEKEGIDKNSLIWVIFMTSSVHATIFLGKDHSENLHSIRNTGQKPTVQKLCDATQTLIREQEFGDLGSARMKLESRKRQGGHPAHEGKHFMYYLCFVCEKIS